MTLYNKSNLYTFNRLPTIHFDNGLLGLKKQETKEEALRFRPRTLNSNLGSLLPSRPWSMICDACLSLGTRWGLQLSWCGLFYPMGNTSRLTRICTNDMRYSHPCYKITTNGRLLRCRRSYLMISISMLGLFHRSVIFASILQDNEEWKKIACCRSHSIRWVLCQGLLESISWICDISLKFQSNNQWKIIAV